MQNHSLWTDNRLACSGITGSLHNSRFITVYTRARNLALPWTRLIQPTHSFPNTSRFTLILPSDCAYISLVFYMFCQSHSSGFVQLNNAWWRVWWSPICNYLHTYAASLLLGANIFLRISFLNTLNQVFPFGRHPNTYHTYIKQVMHFSFQLFKYEKGKWTMVKLMVVGIPRIPLDSNFFENAILIDFLLLHFLSHRRIR